MKKLLLVGIGCVPLKYLAQALQPYGYLPVVLTQRSALPEQLHHCFDEVQAHEVDIHSPAAVLDYLRNHRKAFCETVAVTSLFDEQFPLIETLAAEFGWASPGPTLAWLSQKNTVLSLVPEYSPPSLCFKAGDVQGLDLNPLAAWGQQLIIKPALSSGGRGLGRLVANELLPAQLQRHLTNSGFTDESEWVLQQQVAGRLLSFEGFVAGGRVRHLGVTSHSRIGDLEVACTYPAEHGLRHALIERGWDCVESLVRRANYQYGYFHCQFIQTATSVYLVDANVGRSGAGTALEVMASAHDLCPYQLLAHMLLLPLLQANCPLSPCTYARRATQATLGSGAYSTASIRQLQSLTWSTVRIGKNIPYAVR
jgi:hypothetical protein